MDKPVRVDFNTLDYNEIKTLSENLSPEGELYKMTGGEIDILNERIHKIVNENIEDKKLFSNMMRLKSHLTLAEEHVKEREQKYKTLG